MWCLVLFLAPVGSPVGSASQVGGPPGPGVAMPDAAVDAAQLPDRVCSRGGVTTGGGGGLGSGVWVWGCAHCGHIPSHCARITRLTRHRRLIHPRSHLTPTVIDHLIPPPPPPPPHNTNRPGFPRPKTPTITPRSLYHPCWALPVVPLCALLTVPRRIQLATCTVGHMGVAHRVCFPTNTPRPHGAKNRTCWVPGCHVYCACRHQSPAE